MTMVTLKIRSRVFFIFECSFVVCRNFIQNKLFSKNLSGIPFMSNRLNHDQVRHISRSDLVPTVCKGYQQMTLAGISFNFTFGLCMKQNQ